MKPPSLARGLRRCQGVSDADLDAQMKAAAKADIAETTEFIEALQESLDEVCVPVSREEKIATMTMWLSNHSNPWTSFLVAAVAVQLLSEEKASRA